MCGNDIKKLFEKTNIELNKAAEWFHCNKLSLNVDKTKFIVFKPTKKNADFNNLTLEIGGKKIERIGNNFPTKSFKFVGINIDENLSWDYHISKVKSKISFANIQIARVKNILPIGTVTNLYNALFRPHLEFGVMTWGALQNLN